MSATTTKLSKFEILSLYKTNILKFLDNLIELFPSESDLIAIRILFENQIPVEESMQTFAARILPAADMIKTRNEKFFLTDSIVFAGIGNEKVSKWKLMWATHFLNKEDKEAIFKWFDLFLGLAEMYTKHVQSN